MHPCFPGLPTKEDLRKCIWGLMVSEQEKTKPDLSLIEPTLNQLGLEAISESLELGDFDRAFAILHDLDRITYGEDFDQSLQAKRSLELQPLHKRVLGLLEHEVINKIDNASLQRFFDYERPIHGATAKWCKFMIKSYGKGQLQKDERLKSDDERAAHIILGSWLILASRSKELRLADVFRDAIGHWQVVVGGTAG